MLLSVPLAGCSAVKPEATAGSAMTRRLNVRSDSMAPTMVTGQVITVDEVIPGTYKPRRQDIVAVHPTVEYQGMQQTQLMIRRVIGIPGDAVSCHYGPLMLNGVALEEPYLHKGDASSQLPFDVKVPAGCLWLLGDHRDIAIDCRYHLEDPNQGAIPIGNVVDIYRP
jgi:signal peptidase I